MQQLHTGEKKRGSTNVHTSNSGRPMNSTRVVNPPQQQAKTVTRHTRTWMPRKRRNVSAPDRDLLTTGRTFPPTTLLHHTCRLTVKHIISAGQPLQTTYKRSQPAWIIAIVLSTCNNAFYIYLIRAGLARFVRQWPSNNVRQVQSETSM